MGDGPVFNWPIIGHDNIKQFLQKCLLKKSLAHAYIFYGPDGVGKTMMAKIFANTILCENYRGYTNASSALNQKEIGAVPCGVCENCRQFGKNLYPDVYFVERGINEKTGEKKASISIAQIRELIDRIGKHAFQNSYKIVIISEAHLMQKEASNCLLKTLEEPTDKTILILLAQNKSSLLPTIVSRCQAIRFLPITRDAIYNYLISVGADRSLALELTGLAQGRPTVAMQFLASGERLEQYKKKNRELLAVLTMKTGERFKYVESLINTSSNDEVVEVLSSLESLLRDLVLIQLYSEDLLSHSYLQEEMGLLIGKYTIDKLVEAMKEIEKTKIYIKQNVNPRIALENLIINI